MNIINLSLILDIDMWRKRNWKISEFSKFILDNKTFLKKLEAILSILNFSFVQKFSNILVLVGIYV